jgi:RimJ/RimL family protein N-acetyltransferase
VWRSAVNTECKLLLIDHAFDKLGVNRVMLKTDILNIRSQTAIRRIGGLSEGVLRRHRRRPDGTWRDTAYFSILDDEWPAHRARLTR